jgi:hypothetical protein
MKDFCIILVFNKKFVDKSKETIKQIREIGKYNGDIVCIIGDDLKDDIDILYQDENIIIKHFKEADKDKINEILKNNPITLDMQGLYKPIQWHKFNCFRTYFRDNYKKCLYLDTGMSILKPLDKIINLNCEGKFLAHSDAYPTYQWKLNVQFDGVVFPNEYNQLINTYNLNVDYFQTTMFMFDTKIINDDSYDTLLDLSNKFPNSKTNDQGIMNLYFLCTRNVWEQIKIKDEETYYYDFSERNGLIKNNYIMLKYPQT